MGKLVKRVRKFRVIAVCLSFVLGVMGVCGGAVAKAGVNSDLIIMQNIYKINYNTTVVFSVKVCKQQYEANGVTLVCTNGDASTAKTYHVSALSGTITFPDGNSATVQLGDDYYYTIKYVINIATVPEHAKLYIYSGDVEADFNGRYFLF